MACASAYNRRRVAAEAMLVLCSGVGRSDGGDRGLFRVAGHGSGGRLGSRSLGGCGDDYWGEDILQRRDTEWEFKCSGEYQPDGHRADAVVGEGVDGNDGDSAEWDDFFAWRRVGQHAQVSVDEAGRRACLLAAVVWCTLALEFLALRALRGGRRTVPREAERLWH